MFDIAVIGSGFGGSLLALIARRLGRSVLLLERGTHPRFAIGESSTPLADLLWLELTERYELPELAPFAKWGTWRKAHPEVACGLKRGFTFLHHRMGRSPAETEPRPKPLLVAASPHDDIADTHWYRPDFDHFLVRAAIRHGAEYVDQCEVTGVAFDATSARLETRGRSGTREFRARFVVDAGNHQGCLARSLGLQEEPLPCLPPTQALFTHFRDVKRLGGTDGLPADGAGPFPIDDAALHHVFEDGWIWVLRFVNGITSAGVAMTDTAARRLRLGDTDRAGAWSRLLGELPDVAAQFRDATPVAPWIHSPRVSFRLSSAAGNRWALLPSAAGFVDPLLSSGFLLTLLGIERIARMLGEGWDDGGLRKELLHQHTTETAAEQLAVERYVAALYATMKDFEAFTEIARLYFCAVIFCETARRLGRPEAAGGLLMRQHPHFAPAARHCCAMAMAGAGAAELRRHVEPVVARFDLGGFDDASRRPWYPVLADDLRVRRGRIGASGEEVEALLRRAGFTGRGIGTESPRG